MNDEIQMYTPFEQGLRAKPVNPSGRASGLSLQTVIRRMRLEDVPAVHAIDTFSFSMPWPERSFRFEVTENAASRAWVAEAQVNGKTQILGMLVLWIVVDEAHIATLAVHPDFRRNGIGSRIIVEALTAAFAEGARRAFLEVRAGNTAAQAIYRKFGFEVTGRRPRHYKDNDEDAILMSLESLDVGALEPFAVLPGLTARAGCSNVPTCQPAHGEANDR